MAGTFNVGICYTYSFAYICNSKDLQNCSQSDGLACSAKQKSTYEQNLTPTYFAHWPDFYIDTRAQKI